jgi:glyoxylase-like metal-dependent hydrolase (beta-lactamase superfamily II)
MRQIMADIITLDLGYRGRGEVIASFLAQTGDRGFALFESGPGVTLEQLEREVAAAGFSMSDLRALFLTHVHLDHAGAAGEIAQTTGCSVHVHPVGAPHLGDPEAKLLPSARRIYGGEMAGRWGRTVAVPREQLRVTEHGDRVSVGNLRAVAWNTPGHATHHVVWQLDDTIVAGDVAGVRFPGSEYVVPPMPPPDINVEQWRASLQLIRELDPSRLLLTHFGRVEDVTDHLDRLEDRIDRWTDVARDAFEDGVDVAGLADRLQVVDDRDLAAAGVPLELVGRGRGICAIADAAAGLYRYQKKRHGVRS